MSGSEDQRTPTSRPEVSGRSGVDLAPSCGAADAAPITVLQLKPLQVAIVHTIAATDQDAVRLKRLGVCEGRQIQMVKTGDPLILRVLGTRVGISAQLAPSILVRPCGACGPGTK